MYRSAPRLFADIGPARDCLPTCDTNGICVPTCASTSTSSPSIVQDPIVALLPDIVRSATEQGSDDPEYNALAAATDARSAAFCARCKHSSRLPADAAAPSMMAAIRDQSHTGYGPRTLIGPANPSKPMFHKAFHITHSFPTRIHQMVANSVSQHVSHVVCRKLQTSQTSMHRPQPTIPHLTAQRPARFGATLEVAGRLAGNSSGQHTGRIRHHRALHRDAGVSLSHARTVPLPNLPQPP